MVIGVLSAMENEISSIRLRMQAQPYEVVSSMQVYRVEEEGNTVYLAVCGEGKANAALGAEAFCLRYSPDVMLFTGVAGGVSDGLLAGDIVVGTSYLQHDFDLSPLGYEPASIPNLKGIRIHADAMTTHALLDATQKEIHIGKARLGLMATGDQFISSAEKARAIHETYNADCVDMESAAFAQVCFLNHTDFAVLRAISDNGDGSAFRDFRDFLNYAVKATTNIICRFIRDINTWKKV